VESLANDRRIVQRVLSEYAEIPYFYGDIRNQVVFDTERDHYLVITTGRNWDGLLVHDCSLHIDLINGKFWIQHDATDRPVALELEAAGVPKDLIVLGFREPKIRPYTGYAVA